MISARELYPAKQGVAQLAEPNFYGVLPCNVCRIQTCIVKRNPYQADFVCYQSLKTKRQVTNKIDQWQSNWSQH